MKISNPYGVYGEATGYYSPKASNPLSIFLSHLLCQECIAGGISRASVCFGGEAVNARSTSCFNTCKGSGTTLHYNICERFLLAEFQRHYISAN